MILIINAMIKDQENTRLKFNRKILSKISNLMYTYPNMRFGQILCDLGINELEHAADFTFIKDNFNEESEVMFNRINKSNQATAHRLSWVTLGNFSIRKSHST